MKRMVALTWLLGMCMVISAGAQNQFSRIKVTHDLEIVKLSDRAFVHVSYADIPGFGRVASNGLIYADSGKAFLFDTPTTDSLTSVLVQWMKDSLKVEIVGFVPNHWHNDCMGGLGYLQSIGVESYANRLTCMIAREKQLPVPRHAFNDSLLLSLAGRTILCWYPGPAHTVDNIVVWIPGERILFGGCMVKSMQSPNLGNLADAVVAAWPATIAKVLERFPDPAVVVPGHGDAGGRELLEHTAELLKAHR